MDSEDSDDALFSPRQIVGGLTLLIGSLLHEEKAVSGHDIIPGITPHVGNFAYAAGPGLVAWLTNEAVDSVEDMYECTFTKLNPIRKYLLETTSIATAAYFTLGETILPQILPGTADPLDIPAALIAVTASYLFVKREYT